MGDDAPPRFRGGHNIAVKVPAHRYEAAVAYYRDSLGLEIVESSDSSTAFQFGPIVLWLDRRDFFSQPEIWLEVVTDDTRRAASHLEAAGGERRDEIEPLPASLDAFWIADPAGVIHLVSGERERSE